MSPLAAYGTTTTDGALLLLNFGPMDVVVHGAVRDCAPARTLLNSLTCAGDLLNFFAVYTSASPAWLAEIMPMGFLVGRKETGMEWVRSIRNV